MKEIPLCLQFLGVVKRLIFEYFFSPKPSYKIFLFFRDPNKFDTSLNQYVKLHI